MIDQAQVQLTQSLLDQSKAAAQQAYQAWGMVMQSQKAFLDSMRGAGAPFALAADQYEKMIDYQAQQYKAALEYMDKMSSDFQQQLTKKK
jgi:uncharacterized damage-inducible protein DinB